MNSPSAAQLDDATPASMPRALPAWVYNHPALTRLEQQRILMPSWQIVCHVNSIPQAGDYETFDLGPESVVVLRDRDGSIRAFHNVCRHRGARLLDGAGNCPATITCPYHGWTYRHDGGLIGMPVRESFPGLDRAEHGLRTVRTDIAFGFVFVCLAPDSEFGAPPPVSRTWGKLGEELAPYRCEEMVPLGPITSDVWNVDWKIAMDNYLESYHVPIGHHAVHTRMSSSRTTCPSDIRVCTACLLPTTRIRPPYPAWRGASPGCARSARHAGPRACISR
jgi:phenylpropionate dioxygenase-like ring-hydroxylating dioxygenase large terminal subunit